MKKINAFALLLIMLLSVFTVTTTSARNRDVISTHTLSCCSSTSIDCLIAKKGNMTVYKNGVNCGINPTPVSLTAPPPIPYGYTEYNDIFIPSSSDPTHGTGYKACTVYIDLEPTPFVWTEMGYK